VGERWALLVVRDLLLGPRRFTDLQRGLGKVPTNVLSSRLKELEESGVIRRRVLPRPARGVAYELTDYGRALEPVLEDLMLWGARAMGPPRADDGFSPNSFLLGLRIAFQPDAARDLSATYEISIDDSTFHVRVADGELELGEGPAQNPDLSIETDLRLGELLQGEVSPQEAVAQGIVKLEGKRSLLRAFAAAFRMPRPAASGS
jgi:DNA-binding HxlR family transcriptional regulator/putative sterol carrier protein